MHQTLPLLQSAAFPPIHRRALETLQEMGRETLDAVVRFLAARGARTLDITGGAPELHPQFRSLVERARALRVKVIDRCNLTILEEPRQEDLARLLAAQAVEIVASLPSYTEEQVDRQRGRGVYHASIRALQQLNQLGYGEAESGLVLNLVYNPQGPSLPRAQDSLEADYKRQLAERPNGYVYDCDFNQMLGLPLRVDGRPRLELADLIGCELDGNPIAVREHCFGCTAGHGSSCGGALQR